MRFVVLNKWIPKGFAGITIFPFVFVAEEKWLHNSTFIIHERIHLRQQIELLVLPFFIWYGLEYIVRIFQYRNKSKAYRNISFEREAYANESNPNYLKQRRLFSFIRYL